MMYGLFLGTASPFREEPYLQSRPQLTLLYLCGRVLRRTPVMPRTAKVGNRPAGSTSAACGNASTSGARASTAAEVRAATASGWMASLTLTRILSDLRLPTPVPRLHTDPKGIRAPASLRTSGSNC